MSEVNVPEFWESIYRRGRPGWDLDGPTPTFRRIAERGPFEPGRMVVLGAGRGHDARLFARHDYDVTAIDFAEEAVRAMVELADPAAPVTILKANLFDLPPTLEGRFNYVLEYTLFCAIDPARRPEYARIVASLLRPGGHVIALVFPITGHEGGPPFSVDPDQYIEIMGEQGMVLVHRETPHDSVPARQGKEELVVLRKGGEGGG